MNDRESISGELLAPGTDPYEPYDQARGVPPVDFQPSWSNDSVLAGIVWSPSLDTMYFDNEDVFGNVGIMMDNEGISDSSQFSSSPTPETACVDPRELESTSGPASMAPTNYDSFGEHSVTNQHSVQRTVTVSQKPSSPRRRARKKDPKTRPCDLKREQRKIQKPLECCICNKGHAWQRDLDRHYVRKHPDEAARRGLDMSIPRCPYKNCGKTFALGRKDYLKKHLRNKHGWSKTK